MTTCATAVLDIGVASERIGACPFLAGADGGLSSVAPLRSLSPVVCCHCYIAVEHRQSVANDIPVWPDVGGGSRCRPGRLRSDGVACNLLSAALHCSILATAFAAQPLQNELPAGGTQAVFMEVMDETTFAALQEGSEAGKEVPKIKLPVPEPPDPLDVSEISPPKTASLPMHTPPVPEMALPVIAPDVTTPAPDLKPAPVKPRENSAKKRKTKVATQRGNGDSGAGTGVRGTGADRLSSALNRRGVAGRVEGMAGKAERADYRATVIAHLGRYKRYPRSAMAHRLEGRVRITFTIDRDGRVKSSSINVSSGYGVLDQDALAMLNRAQPFPKMPTGTGRSGVTITTQIGYTYPR